MEYLETYEEEKRRLIENSVRYKKKLAEQLDSITSNTKKVTTNAVVVGGSLLLTYLVVRQFAGGKTKDKKKKKNKKSSTETEDAYENEERSIAATLFSQFGDALISHASIILLDLAKDKLSSYLESRKIEDEDS